MVVKAERLCHRFCPDGNCIGDTDQSGAVRLGNEETKSNRTIFAKHQSVVAVLVRHQEEREGALLMATPQP
jgi:hypothetical protein